MEEEQPTTIPAFTQAALDRYRHLRAKTLIFARAYATRNEQAYHDLIDKGLRPLERFMEKTVKTATPDVQQAFARAAGVQGPETINDILGYAADLFRDGPGTIFEKLKQGGAVFQQVLGVLVKPDPDAGGVKKPTTGKHKFEIKAAGSKDGPSKTEMILEALLDSDLQIYSDDFLITTSEVRDDMMRKSPYTLIDIRRLNRQIAVCDQMDQVTFVSHHIHDVDVWANNAKSELSALPGMARVQYDSQGGWTARALKIIASDLPPERKKVRIPRPGALPLLTEDTLARWVQATHDYNEKYHPERRYLWPSTSDDTVWDRDENGAFIEVKGESWKSTIKHACIADGRGLKGLGSLSQFKDKRGLNDNLTEEKVVRYLLATHEQTGVWPSALDTEVYDKGEDGKIFLVKQETWHKINHACVYDFRGLKGLGSLALLKEKRGFNDDLTEEQIVRRIKATHKQTGVWPMNYHTDVYDEDENEKIFLVKNETWQGIDTACKDNTRGLKDLGSLRQLKDKHGLNDNLTREIVRRIMDATYAKTKKHLTTSTMEVWDLDEKTGEFVPYDTTGAGMDARCVARGLGTLAELRKELLPDAPVGSDGRVLQIPIPPPLR